MSSTSKIEEKNGSQAVLSGPNGVNILWIFWLSFIMSLGALFFELLQIQGTPGIVYNGSGSNYFFKQFLGFKILPAHDVPIYFFGFYFWRLISRNFKQYLKLPNKMFGFTFPKMNDPLVISDSLAQEYLARWYFLNGLLVLSIFSELVEAVNMLLKIISIPSLSLSLWHRGSMFAYFYTCIALLIATLFSLAYLRKRILNGDNKDVTFHENINATKRTEGKQFVKRLAIVSIIVCVIGLVIPFVFSAVYLGVLR